MWGKRSWTIWWPAEGGYEGGAVEDGGGACGESWGVRGGNGGGGEGGSGGALGGVVRIS